MNPDTAVTVTWPTSVLKLTTDGVETILAVADLRSGKQIEHLLSDADVVALRAWLERVENPEWSREADAKMRAFMREDPALAESRPVKPSNLHIGPFRFYVQDGRRQHPAEWQIAILDASGKVLLSGLPPTTLAHMLEDS